jgi:hypothetical protein
MQPKSRCSSSPSPPRTTIRSVLGILHTNSCRATLTFLTESSDLSHTHHGRGGDFTWESQNLQSTLISGEKTEARTRSGTLIKIRQQSLENYSILIDKTAELKINSRNESTPRARIGRTRTKMVFSTYLYWPTHRGLIPPATSA